MVAAGSGVVFLPLQGEESGVAKSCHASMRSYMPCHVMFEGGEEGGVEPSRRSPCSVPLSGAERQTARAGQSASHAFSWEKFPFPRSCLSHCRAREDVHHTLQRSLRRCYEVQKCPCPSTVLVSFLLENSSSSQCVCSGVQKECLEKACRGQGEEFPEKAQRGKVPASLFLFESGTMLRERRRKVACPSITDRENAAMPCCMFPKWMHPGPPPPLLMETFSGIWSSLLPSIDT